MRIFQVDAFTDQPFRGNPAAVCLLDREMESGWMQQVAMEMNLSETAFIRLGATQQLLPLRWFTPATEVPLCGHATLAAAHVLFEEGLVRRDRIDFTTKSGVLTTSRLGDQVELTLPSSPPKVSAAPPGLSDALGAEPAEILESPHGHLALLGSAAEVRGLAPDPSRLAALPVRALMVTAEGDREFDFVSRFFAPALGVVEDPVTGSAHCTLAPFWAERLGRRELTSHQASPRSGVLRVRVEGERVHLLGRAVTVLRGELNSSLCDAG